MALDDPNIDVYSAATAVLKAGLLKTQTQVSTLHYKWYTSYARFKGILRGHVNGCVIASAASTIYVVEQGTNKDKYATTGARWISQCKFGSDAQGHAPHKVT